MQPDETIRDEAALWAVRTGDPAFDDWDGFTLWLERDSAHARAYDAAVSGVEDALGALAPAPLPVTANDEDEGASSPAWRRWFGPALAASLAGLLALGVWQMQGGETLHATAAGETRTIALADGSSIALGGDSRLLLDEDEPRFARLEQGQALLRIRHDDANPFRLVAGNDTLVDAGTIFDVRLGRDRLDVEVAEGAVIVNPQTRNLRLDPGERVTRLGGDYRTGAVATDAVGEWNAGRITFRGATLTRIAEDLTRATGVTFAAEPGSGNITLSGSVLTDPLRSDPATLGPLLGVTVQRQGETWVIAAR
jgi:transmembrane sensor